MKESRVRKILEYLQEGAVMSAELFVAIVAAGHGTSRGQIERKLDEIQNRGRGKKPEALKKRRKSFYATLYRMRRDGLVGSKEGKWFITQQGKSALEKRSGYKSEKDGTLKIIVFDIPEEMRVGRDWVRSVLKNLGFEMLQRSVWIGRVKIPGRFIEDLRKKKLLAYVEILAVTKRGSLEDIKN